MAITSKYPGPRYLPCYIQRSINSNRLSITRSIVDALADNLPKIADHLEAARPDQLVFTAFPIGSWRVGRVPALPRLWRS